jgi:hypothetical protein
MVTGQLCEVSRELNLLPGDGEYYYGAAGFTAGQAWQKAGKIR